MSATLTVLAGLPGCGKSTYTAAHHGRARVLSADAIRAGESARAVFQGMHRSARQSLIQERDVWIDACSLQARARMEWLGIALATESRAVLVIIDTPLATCRQRDRVRHERATIDWQKYAREWTEMQTAIRREGWALVQRAAGA